MCLLHTPALSGLTGNALSTKWHFFLKGYGLGKKKGAHKGSSTVQCFVRTFGDQRPGAEKVCGEWPQPGVPHGRKWLAGWREASSEPMSAAYRVGAGAEAAVST